MENGDIILEARGVSCPGEPGNGALSRLLETSLVVRQKTLNLLAGDEQGGRGTLLHLLGLLETPDEGGIFFHGEPAGALTCEARAEMRNQRFGFLFAEPFLLPTFSVIENVAMPLFKISGVEAREAQQRTEQMLAFTGMQDFADMPVERLTFVQQQRVSLARALVNQPEVLIVENVDAGISGDELARFIEDIHRAVREFGMTAILTAGTAQAAGFPGRVIELENGAVCRDTDGAIKAGGTEA